MELVLSWSGNDPVFVLIAVVGAFVRLLLCVAQVIDELVNADEANDRVGLIVGRVWLGLPAHVGIGLSFHAVTGPPGSEAEQAATVVVAEQLGRVGESVALILAGPEVQHREGLRGSSWLLWVIRKTNSGR